MDKASSLDADIHNAAVHSATTATPPDDLLENAPNWNQAYVPFDNYTSLGVPQLFHPKLRADVQKRSYYSLTYFRKSLDTAVRFTEAMEQYEELKDIRKECVLRDERCWIWSALG